MIIIKSTDTLEINMAQSGVKLDSLVCGREIDSTTFSPFREPNTRILGQTAGTDTVIANSATSGTVRLIESITINSSSLSGDSKSGSIKFKISGTTTALLFSFTINRDETIHYHHKSGWYITDKHGRRSQVLIQSPKNVLYSPTRVVVTSDVTNGLAANTLQAVTGLSFSTNSNKKYWFRAVIQYTVGVATTGTRWVVSHGLTLASVSIRSEYSLTTTSTTVNEGVQGVLLPSATNASSAAVGSNIAIIEGFFETLTGNTFEIQNASEIAAGNLVTKVGSYMDYLQLN